MPCSASAGTSVTHAPLAVACVAQLPAAAIRCPGQSNPSRSESVQDGLSQSPKLYPIIYCFKVAVEKIRSIRGKNPVSSPSTPLHLHLHTNNYAHAHTYTYTYTQTHTRTRTHARTHTHAHTTRTHAPTHARTNASTHAHTRGPWGGEVPCPSATPYHSKDTAIPTPVAAAANTAAAAAGVPP